ncbi:MAG: hypothetical protein WEB58_15005 [Planctomycetaceae bacterium]
MTEISDPQTSPDSSESNDLQIYVRRHIRWGWWLLTSFLSLGIVLEGLHAFKIGMYLDVSNETRRLMWTLAHAHGTLFGLLHIAFAATLAATVTQTNRSHAIASKCLTAASLLLPLGFLLGGAYTYSGDPGYGIVFVPVGGVLLLIAAGLTAVSVSRHNL